MVHNQVLYLLLQAIVLLPELSVLVGLPSDLVMTSVDLFMGLPETPV
jgi:hypothetical protein